MIALAETPSECFKADLPATVVAELEFDSINPPPDTVEEATTN